METTLITIEDIKSTMQAMRKGEIEVAKGRHLAVLMGGHWYPAKQLVTHTALVCDIDRWQYSPEEAVALLCELTFVRAEYIDFQSGKPVQLKTSLAIQLCSQLKMMQDRILVFW